MELKELLNKVGDENQIIMLILDSEYVSAFPATYCPKEYEGYIVESFTPDRFDGDSPFDGIVIKVWVTEKICGSK